jgi:TM2 domain-containing membrane protein YozV
VRAWHERTKIARFSTRNGHVPQSIMTRSLLVKKPSKAKGVVPAAASFVVPGVGQLINGQGSKALGVFGVAVATGAAFMTGLPLIGAVIGIAHLATHGYAVGDAYIQARKKR